MGHEMASDKKERENDMGKTTNAPKEFAKRCFNIIDSVKGGSGKTSLSLMLTLAAQKYMQETLKSKGHDTNYSLLMDMDMQGSSLDYLLFGGSFEDKAPNTLNDAILKYYTRETPQFISKPKLFFSSIPGGMSGEDEPTAGCDQYFQIAVALASKDIEERDRFRAVSRMNYSSQITYDAFGSGLRAILMDKHLNSYLADRPQYIFFDMPPNSNGYSDCVLELLLSSTVSNGDINSRYPRNYFELMTLDRGHIETTLDWFQQFVERERYQFPDHFFFVFSNVTPNISGMSFDEVKNRGSDSYLRDAIDMVQKRFNKVAKLRESRRERIHFVGVTYQEAYLQRCCSTGCLAGKPGGKLLTRTILSPVSFLADVNGNYEAADTDALLKLMCTKGE